MKIEKTKLDKLYTHVKSNGSSELEVVAGVLGCETDDEATVDAYVEALMSRNPELFGEAPIPEAPVPVVEPLKVFLKDENNIIEELEVLSNKNGKVVCEKKIPREWVEVSIKGALVKVDLLELERTAADAVVHGVKVEELVVAARIARA